jgi:hypothetical protein
MASSLLNPRSRWASSAKSISMMQLAPADAGIRPQLRPAYQVTICRGYGPREAI